MAVDVDIKAYMKTSTIFAGNNVVRAIDVAIPNIQEPILFKAQQHAEVIKIKEDRNL